MLTIVIRVIIIYIIAIVVMRLMGKRQIGEMEPFELVITLIIADLATIPMADPTIPIWYGILPLLVIQVLHFFVVKLQVKSKTFRNILSGSPVIVVSPAGIDYKKLKELDICEEELMELLHGKDVFDVKDIDYAILESSGKISVVPKGDGDKVSL
ncbi:MAG: DUF421 domain-containing protein [Clostridia bacterium]|nr:DUF421 domain-containing protein [Clostridia bacterium]